MFATINEWRWINIPASAEISFGKAMAGSVMLESEWINETLNEWMNEPWNAWMNEPWNAWMNEALNA